MREVDSLLGAKTFIANQIFRGDSFQIAQSAPARSLVDALGLYLAMQLPLLGEGPRVEVRMGIGIGEHSRPGGEIDLGWWSGSAFENAAEALDTLRSDRIALRTPWPEVDEEFAISLALLSALMRRWTSEQRNVLFSSLCGKNQAQVGEELGVSQSAVSQRLKLLGWDAITELRDRFEERIGLGLTGNLYTEGDGAWSS